MPPVEGAPRWRRAAAGYGPAAVLLAIAVALWQAGTAAFAVPTWILPSPAAIANDLWVDRSLLLANGGATVVETLLGFAASFLAAVGLAVAIRFSRTLERALWPLLVASQTVPVPAIAPALVIWFGYGLAPKVVVVGLICFFPVVVATVDGFRGVDGDVVRALRTLGAGGGRVFWEVEVPTALPALFSGTKVAVTYSVIGAVLGEWVGASRGLGFVMIEASSQMVTARVFAAIVLLAVFGVALFASVSLLEHLLLPWYPAAGFSAHGSGPEPLPR